MYCIKTYVKLFGPRYVFKLAAIHILGTMTPKFSFGTSEAKVYTVGYVGPTDFLFQKMIANALELVKLLY